MDKKEIKQIKKRFKEIEEEFDLIDIQTERGLNVRQDALELTFNL